MTESIMTSGEVIGLVANLIAHGGDLDHARAIALAQSHERLRDALAQAWAERDLARHELREVQWAAPVTEVRTGCCPRCGALPTVGHYPDCPIPAALEEHGDD